MDAGESDEDLITRWRIGRDQFALNTLISRYLPRFYGTARAMLIAVEEAEDIAQDVMLKVIQAIERFDARFTFQAWSYTILLNTVRNSVRQRKQRGKRFELTPHLDEVAVSECGAGDRLEAEEAKSMLDGAMRKLSEKQRVAVVLMLLEGLSAAEVAQIEGCSTDAVYQRVTEARKLLRGEMQLKRSWLGE